ncbi:hypothetical protein AYI70_g11884 [Smittium culicis]|uniref:Uncharacterized protein n=1 Tax=Smittium culicis TaxID=133412 RepID=A0A1R1WZW7_9FUNG|nr:hypothetical protein AYI70_g11884 [Smittium culicis]
MLRQYISAAKPVYKKSIISIASQSSNTSKNAFKSSKPQIRPFTSSNGAIRQSFGIKDLILRISNRKNIQDSNSSNGSHQNNSINNESNSTTRLSLNIDEIKGQRPKKSFTWRLKGQRNGKDYVGLRVALDAKHAEKAWISFHLEPLDSVLQIGIDSDHKHVWDKYYNSTESVVQTSDIQTMIRIFNNIEGVLLEILQTFSVQLEAEISQNLAEIKLNDILNKDIPAFNGYWGHRIMSVFNQIISIKKFYKDLGITLEASNSKNEESILTESDFETILKVILNSITNNCQTGISYNLDTLVKLSQISQNCDTDSNSQTQSNPSTKSSPLDLISIESIQSTGSTLQRTYYDILRLYGSQFNLNTSHLNHLLLACFLSNDTQLALESLNYFLNFNTNLDSYNIPSIFSNSDISASETKETSADEQIGIQAAFIKKAQGLFSDSPSVDSLVKPNPLTFAIISKIAGRISTDNTNDPKYQSLSLEIAKKSLGLFKKISITDESFTKASSKVDKSLSFLFSNQLLIDNFKNIIPELEVISNLFGINMKLDDIPEALNCYESFKLLITNHKSMFLEVAATENSPNIETLPEPDARSTLLLYFNDILRSSCQPNQDWLVKLILSDLNLYGLKPNKDSFEIYFNYVNACHYEEKVSKTVELFSEMDLIYTLGSPDSQDLIIDIMSSISATSGFISNTGSSNSANSPEHQSKFNSLGSQKPDNLETAIIDFYTKWVSITKFSEDSYKLATSALIKCICTTKSLVYLDACLNLTIGDEKTKNFVSIQDSILLMNAYTVLGKPDVSLKIFQGLLANIGDSVEANSVKAGLYTAAMVAYFKAGLHMQVLEIWNELVAKPANMRTQRQSRDEDGDVNSDQVPAIRLEEFDQTAFDVSDVVYIFYDGERVWKDEEFGGVEASIGTSEYGQEHSDEFSASGRDFKSRGANKHIR